MKTRVQELIQIGDQLYSKRFPLLTLWQTFAENFYPLRADMTHLRGHVDDDAAALVDHQTGGGLSDDERRPDVEPEQQVEGRLVDLEKGFAAG